MMAMEILMTDQPQTQPAPSTKAAARSAGAGAKKPKTHAAAAGRILAAGLSTGATFGLVAALAANAPAATVKLSSSAGSKDSPIMKGDRDPIDGDALPGDDHLGDGRVGVDPAGAGGRCR